MLKLGPRRRRPLFSPVAPSLLDALESRTLLSGAPPVAVNDSYAVFEDTVLVVPAAEGVLANDTDPEIDPADTLEAQLVAPPAHGSLTLNADGSFTYTPEPGYVGLDSFVYNAFDGLSASAGPASVEIDVAVLPVKGDAYAIRPTASLVVDAPGVLANDTVPAGSVVSLVTPPATGTLTLNPDGSFNYVPAEGFAGESFVYAVMSGEAVVGTATVQISADAAPVAVEDAYDTPMDTTLTVAAPGILANDQDIADLQSIVIQSMPMHGALTLNADGSFEYVPVAGYQGLDSFSYALTDNLGVGNSANVILRVVQLVASPNLYVTPQDTALVVDAPGLLGNDTYPPGVAVELEIVSGPGNGLIGIGDNGAFTYLPLTGYFGVETFTYRINYAGISSAPGTVTINVLEDLSYLPEVTITDAALRVEEYAGNAVIRLERIGDPAMIDITYVISGGTATPGTFAAAGVDYLLADGVISFMPSQTHYNLVVPIIDDALPEGDETFTVTLTGISGARLGDIRTSTVTISDDEVVNHPPVVLPLQFTRAPGEALTIDPLDYATDAEGGPLTLTIATNPAYGMLVVDPNATPDNPADDFLVYTPFDGAMQDDSFVYRVTDPAGASSTAMVTIAVRGGGLTPSPVDPALTDLVVAGTSGNDVVSVYQTAESGGVMVQVNASAYGPFSPTGRIVVNLGAGNDRIAASNIAQPCWFYGGAGNDTILGTAGDDVLVGGNGRDVLKGYAGRDLLIGGMQADKMYGNGGSDLIVGGRTVYDAFSTANQIALDDLMAAGEGVTIDEWVAAIRRAAGVGASGAKLNKTTVFDDRAKDLLDGRQDRDWLYARSTDTLRGAAGDGFTRI